MTFDSNNCPATEQGNAPSSIQVTADPRSVLRGIGATFSGKLVVLGELLQNARRAGATHVDFFVTDDVVVVQDNGCGISDFGILFSLAKSGWDQGIQEAEGPYGMGLCAAIFACKALGIMSLGKHVYAMTQDLQDLKAVPVNDSADLGVTEFRLHDYNFGTAAHVRAYLRKLVRGFPIPVFLDGEELPRPDALENLEVIAASIGHVSRVTVETDALATYYLQGLPIHVWEGHHDLVHTSKSVVHLDPTAFKGRMPDRAYLVDAESASKTITEELRALRISFLEERRRVMSEEAFCAEHYGEALKLGMKDLLNSLSRFPGHWAWTFEGDPVLQQHVEDGRDYPSEDWTRDAVAKHGLMEFEDYADEQEYLLCRQFVHGAGVLATDGRAPFWHWSRAHTQSVEPYQFSWRVGNSLGSDEVMIFGTPTALCVVDKILAKWDPGDATAEEIPLQLRPLVRAEVEIAARYDADNNVLYVTPETDPWVAARNIVTFTDSDDRHDEHVEYVTCQAIAAVRQAILSPDPVGLLRSMLDNGLPRRFPNALKGSRFLLEFDEQGVLSVKQAT